METSNFRSELHVAQQSRRDKLRVLQHHHHPNHPDQNVAEIYGSSNHHNHMDQFSGGTNNTMNPDLVHLRTGFNRYGNNSSNLSYESATTAVYSSDNMLQALLVHHHHHNHPDSDKRIASSSSAAVAGGGGDDNSSFGNSSAKMIISGADPQNCSPWKSMITGGGGQESCDWVSCSTIDGNHPNPVFVAEGLKANNNSSSPAISAVYNMKQQQQSVLLNYGYHQDLRSSSSLTGPSGENNSTHKQYGDMNFYQNNNNIGSFHEVTSTTNNNSNNNARETGRVSNWSHTSGNELVLLPAFADHVNAMDYSENKVAGDNSNTQVLSLSLSSVPSSKQQLFGGSGGTQVPEKLPADFMCSFNAKPPQPPPPPTSSYDTVVGNSAAFAQRGSGPLGPFTGYATILKSSKFLRPAQHLMDEFCNILAPKSFNMLESACDKVSARIGVTGTTDHQSVAGGFAGGDSGGSSSTFFSSNEKIVRDGGGLSSSNIESYKPEFLQKKAKLMYMQDEVCKRYKNYHQQMEMVVSSFETVAGLSAATPYLSLALKTVSRHFRSLRNAISDQLKNVRKALGEDLSSLITTGTSSSKGGDTMSSSRQKVIDQTSLHQKQKTVGAGNMGFFEPQQQHVWRPQRGLPERAVAILRAWLFDHFLHPYPTDADKHMLASQTGLTRNQVSNWFINARVRVWKPMVEEIHTLETKGGVVGEAGPSGGGKTEGKGGTPTDVGSHHSNDNQVLISNRLSDKQSAAAAAECSDMMVSSTFTMNRLMMMNNNSNTTETTATWDDQEKRSRLDCRNIPGGGGLDGGGGGGSLVGFMPYQQSGIDIGGLGAVSLTLGLRQNNAGADQQGVQQQHENQLRRHFGDHIIYDFVG